MVWRRVQRWLEAHPAGRLGRVVRDNYCHSDRWVVVTQAAVSLILEPKVVLADLETLSIARASDSRPWDLSSTL
jgi:hypothetical protein